MSLNALQFTTIEDIKSYYLNNIARYGVEAPRTMGYHSAPIDDRLISNLLPDDLPNTYSVLDVGCGLGQIITILGRNFPLSKLEKLIGLDLIEQFVQQASITFPEHQFFTCNFLEWDSSEQFDLVLAAGVLVTRIEDFNLYLENFIKKMISYSRKWITFNVVGNCGPSYTAKHLATISMAQLGIVLKKFPEMQWDVSQKEVFAGSEDIFVRGQKA